MRKPFIAALAIAMALTAACSTGCNGVGATSSTEADNRAESSQAADDQVQNGDDDENVTTPQTGAAASVEVRADDNAAFTTREIWVDNDGQNIYGVAYLPEGAETAPLVILSHGLGNSHTSMEPYAQQLAENGYAAYIFDFRGGSTGQNLSDGENVGMSVMTEVSDLEAIITAAQTWDFTDSDNIVLLGSSQGGMVTALEAARNPNAPQAVILLYPALSIVDDMHSQFSSEDAVPGTFGLFGGWMTVGRNYATDVWNLDVNGEIADYTGPVLIEHGDADTVVDVSYSQSAAEAYRNCTLNIIQGAGHGFTGAAYEQSLDDILDFLGSNVAAA